MTGKGVAKPLRRLELGLDEQEWFQVLAGKSGVKPRHRLQLGRNGQERCQAPLPFRTWP